jgi:lipopolysaccharide/colanic/teichoic acid biosynthesis glycosyltransferase
MAWQAGRSSDGARAGRAKRARAFAGDRRAAKSHLRRLEVKPGITGLWQVKARRDPSFKTSMALDIEYIDRRSLLLDLKLALETIPTVLKGMGQ